MSQRSLSANGKLCSRRPGRSGHWISKERRLAIYLRDGFACCYCGRDLHNAPARDISLDHLNPQVNGATHKRNDPWHVSSNLVTACCTCNSARQHKPWFKYATAGAVERIKRLRRRAPNVKLARSILAGETPLTEIFTRQF
jgi:5-methylcytosine-specific restriction endonuclease McrA